MTPIRELATLEILIHLGRHDHRDGASRGEQQSVRESSHQTTIRIDRVAARRQVEIIISDCGHRHDALRWHCQRIRPVIVEGSRHGGVRNGAGAQARPTRWNRVRACAARCAQHGKKKPSDNEHRSAHIFPVRPATRHDQWSRYGLDRALVDAAQPATASKRPFIYQTPTPSSLSLRAIPAFLAFSPSNMGRRRRQQTTRLTTRPPGLLSFRRNLEW